MYRSKEDETLRLIRKIMQKQKWQFKIFQSAYFKRKISLQPHFIGVGDHKPKNDFKSLGVS